MIRTTHATCSTQATHDSTTTALLIYYDHHLHRIVSLCNTPSPTPSTQVARQRRVLSWVCSRPRRFALSHVFVVQSFQFCTTISCDNAFLGSQPSGIPRQHRVRREDYSDATQEQCALLKPLVTSSTSWCTASQRAVYFLGFKLSDTVLRSPSPTPLLDNASSSPNRRSCVPYPLLTDIPPSTRSLASSTGPGA
ncbi:hypothetical protein SCHPADRAFT_285312 [Schizopora paradoxa]|uniref:Uncharacterized protein n=1 Tax=Schizopora paradoxa TaxID=27342 RepID=A0A0H2RST9_9AGAM|nr:hypothetical protein SCHPADRAFT_285312 [Schizopora paradoxa]